MTSSVNAVESSFFYWLTAKDLGSPLDKHGSFNDLAMSVDSGPGVRGTRPIHFCPVIIPGQTSSSASVMAVRAFKLQIYTAMRGESKICIGGVERTLDLSVDSNILIHTTLGS